jgi:rare lipoprotein A
MNRMIPLVVAALCIADVFAQGPQPAAPSTPAPAAPAPSPPAPPPTPAPAPATAASGTETGKLAYYGKKFAGRKTASGARYNPDALTMAHKTLPFGTKVKVTNKANGKSVELVVNDRGPTKGDYLGDVSVAAAKQLGFGKHGMIDADVTVVSAAPAGK